MRFRATCHKKILILAGILAFQIPDKLILGAALKNSLYKDPMEKFLEGLTFQVTSSLPSDNRISLSSTMSLCHSVVSSTPKVRLKVGAHPLLVHMSATLGSTCRSIACIHRLMLKPHHSNIFVAHYSSVFPFSNATSVATALVPHHKKRGFLVHHPLPPQKFHRAFCPSTCMLCQLICTTFASS